MFFWTSTVTLKLDALGGDFYLSSAAFFAHNLQILIDAN